MDSEAVLDSASRRSKYSHRCDGSPPHRALRRRGSVWADPKLWLLAAVAFALGIIVTLLINRQAMDTLTQERLDAARERWDAAAIDAYRIEYVMNGDTYIVTCRDGIVQDVTVNDKLPRSSSWGLYSVPGLFNVLQMDLENAADPKGPFRSGHVMLRVIFDDALGYTRRYLRSGGGPRGATIEVRTFERLDSVARP